MQSFSLLNSAAVSDVMGFQGFYLMSRYVGRGFNEGLQPRVSQRAEIWLQNVYGYNLNMASVQQWGISWTTSENKTSLITPHLWTNTCALSILSAQAAPFPTVLRSLLGWVSVGFFRPTHKTQFALLISHCIYQHALFGNLSWIHLGSTKSVHSSPFVSAQIMKATVLRV